MSLTHARRGPSRGFSRGTDRSNKIQALQKRTLSHRFREQQPGCQAQRPQSSMAARAHRPVAVQRQRPLTSHHSQRAGHSLNSTELFHQEAAQLSERARFSQHSLFEDSLYSGPRAPRGALQAATKWSPRAIPQVESWKRLARPHASAPVSAPPSRGLSRGSQAAEMAAMHAELQHHLNQKHLNTRNQFRAFQSTNAGVIDIKVHYYYPSFRLLW